MGGVAGGCSGCRLLLDFASTSPSPGCFPSSDTSSTKPSELCLWEPLCFSAACITHIVDLRGIDLFVLHAFLPSSIPSLVLGLTKVT